MGSKVETVITVSTAPMSMYGLTLGEVADWAARAMVNDASRDILITDASGDRVDCLRVAVPVVPETD